MKAILFGFAIYSAIRLEQIYLDNINPYEL